MLKIFINNREVTQNISEIADVLFKSKLILEELGIHNIYNLSNTKSERSIFNTEKENIIKEVKDKWDNKFPHLGTNINKYYCIKDEYDANYSGSIKFNYGIVSKSILSEFAVDIYKEFDNKNFALIERCFIKLLHVYTPYFAAVVDTENIKVTKMQNLEFQTKMPRTVQWLNYRDNEIIDKIGLENIESAGFYKVEKLDHGYLLILQEKPINNECESEIANQMNVINHLSNFW